jgi:VWFA-related protein
VYNRLLIRRPRFSSIPAATAAAFCAVAVLTAQQQPPAFKSGVDILRVDAAVVDGSGRPVGDLSPADFSVTIDGKARSVTFAQFHGAFETGAPGMAAAAPVAELPGGFASNATTARGRALILIVDVESLAPGHERTLLTAATQLVNGLRPADAAGLMVLPGKGVNLTREHRLVTDAMTRIIGGAPRNTSRKSLTLEEAEGFENNNNLITLAAIERQCKPTETTCPTEIRQLAALMVREASRRIRTVVPYIAGLIERLRPLDAPKAIVLLSGGLPSTFESRSEFRELQDRAKSGGSTFFVVQLDQPKFDASTSFGSNLSYFEANDLESGLADIAGATDAPFYRATGRGEGAFERIRSEILNSYTLGIAVEPRDLDGKTHSIAVRVNRPGLTVRTRKEIAPARKTVVARSPVDVLNEPVDSVELPLVTSTYSTLGSERGALKAIVVLESPGRVALPAKYALAVHSEGKTVFETADAMTPSATGGAGTAVALPLPPGRYRLRAAVLDADDRAGSLETTITVALRQAGGGVQLSDLLVGTTTADGFTPATQLTSSASVSSILELYGRDTAVLQKAAVRLELRKVGQDAVVKMANATLTGDAEDYRRVAQGDVPLEGLAAGQYALSAIVSAEGKAIGRVSRMLVVAPR